MANRRAPRYRLYPKDTVEQMTNLYREYRNCSTKCTFKEAVSMAYDQNAPDLLSRFWVEEVDKMHIMFLLIFRGLRWGCQPHWTVLHLQNCEAAQRGRTHLLLGRKHCYILTCIPLTKWLSIFHVHTQAKYIKSRMPAAASFTIKQIADKVRHSQNTLTWGKLHVMNFGAVNLSNCQVTHQCSKKSRCF